MATSNAGLSMPLHITALGGPSRPPKMLGLKRPFSW